MGRRRPSRGGEMAERPFLLPWTVRDVITSSEGTVVPDVPGVLSVVSGIMLLTAARRAGR